MNRVFKIDRQNFSIETDSRTGTPCIRSIHPYDFTEYHWARREALKSSLREWRVYRSGKQVCTIWLNGSPMNEEEIIARKLKDLDNQANLTPRIDTW